MNTLKKMLVTVTMVVTLGAATSCGSDNKEDPPVFVGGLPYTVFTLSHLERDKEYKVQFECEGDPEVYWNSETPNNEKSHIFKPELNGKITKPIVLIKGNIDNLHFCDNKGDFLADGNSKISAIIFSNTITKLPEYACYSLEFSMNSNDGDKRYFYYLPASIKTIGKNAFFPRNGENLGRYVCEPASRPSGWDANWCTIGELARFMRWGFSYYITDNYDMYYIINDDPIHTACYEGNLKYDIKDLVIPETFKVNNFTCSVVSIGGIGNAGETLENVTIPKSIVAIYNGAFNSCAKLTSVKFADEYDYLWFSPGTFQYCSSLKTITLPKGLVNVPDNTFDGCKCLEYVKIPNSVQAVGSYMFCNAEKNLTIDLTSYTDSKQIATCEDDLLWRCTSETITFKISSSLVEKNFTDKGWPKGNATGTPKIVWETSTTLNA